VTELSAKTGSRIRVLPDSRRNGFNGPAAITANNSYVWVANENRGYGYRITKLRQSTGALVALLASSSYGFDAPAAIARDGTHVWVANFKSQSVTEFPAT